MKMRCAKIPGVALQCSAPGKHWLRRRELPDGVNPERCIPPGETPGWLAREPDMSFRWTIPCCPRHFRELTRCATRGCRNDARAHGLCHPCYRRHERQHRLVRNCPTCLRCGASFASTPYQSAGLCKACHRAVSAPGAEGTTRYSARLRQLNAAEPFVKQACRLIGASGVAERLGVPLLRVMEWASGSGTPVEMESRALALLEEVRG